ncbi:MAG: RNHCP domain-containing protein [Rickettsiales bacterium]|jgi:hypothetical protein|nr:RNHCP domain-containing protein [Rickettsiales bacterium]
MKKFQKRVENFRCENCGRFVEGDGFTNHCPGCLYSKHVDINPGDRACDCGGLMRPLSLLQSNGNLVIVHSCLKCNFARKNKISEADSFDELLRLL